MGRTKKSNWEKLKEFLLKNNISENSINEKIANKNSSQEKYKALEELLTVHNLKFIEDNSPTLNNYFGKVIADLLIERKKIISLNKIDISKLENKTVKDLSNKDLTIINELSKYKNAQKKLESIDKALEKKGIRINLNENKTK
nr:hypothetical protein [Bacteroides intestinalis]